MIEINSNEFSREVSHPTLFNSITHQMHFDILHVNKTKIAAISSVRTYVPQNSQARLIAMHWFVYIDWRNYCWMTNTTAIHAAYLAKFLKGPWVFFGIGL